MKDAPVSKPRTDLVLLITDGIIATRVIPVHEVPSHERVYHGQYDDMNKVFTSFNGMHWRV